MGVTGLLGAGSPLRLDASWRPAVVGHLLSLDADDRYSRFAMPMTDHGMAAYVARIDFARDLCFGMARPDRTLAGFLHLAVQGRVAELGASVALEQRACGVARRLFAAALALARGLGMLEVHLVTGHPVARRVCQGLGYRVEGGWGYPRAKVRLAGHSLGEVRPGIFTMGRLAPPGGIEPPIRP